MNQVNKTDFFPAAFFKYGDCFYTIKISVDKCRYFGRIYNPQAKWLHSTCRHNLVSEIHARCEQHIDSLSVGVK